MTNENSPHLRASASCRRAARFSALVSWLVVNACGPGGASPIPQPTMLEFDDVSATTGIQGGDFVLPTVKGRAGSAPAGATITVTDLDMGDPPFTGVVAADGSFEIVVAANDGEELRLEVVVDGQRSPPLDVIVRDVGDQRRLARSPRLDCLKLSPGFVLEFAAEETQTLSLHSDCAESISVSNARTRLGSAYFDVTTALPLEVAPGASRRLSVAFTPANGNEREDVLFIDVANGNDTIRYPVTLGLP